MKIAFVGKGGAGKTTTSGLFTAHLAHKGSSVLAIDADLNMHLGELLGFETLPETSHISHPKAGRTIQDHLRGTNTRIKEPSHFKKSTPPGEGSNLIRIHDEGDLVLQSFAVQKGTLRFMTVGTYSEDGIGTSCYHNNLSILENVLSHTDDSESVVVADMVAGIDAFAGTLHAQFDLLVLVVEPTHRSVEVFKQYQALAEEAGISDSLVVIGNKVSSEEEEAYLSKHIPAEKLLGFLRRSAYLLEIEREGGAFDITRLESENQELLKTIEERLIASRVDPDIRLKMLHDLHRRYVAQAYITERFGDLSEQIDPNFSYHRTSS